MHRERAKALWGGLVHNDAYTPLVQISQTCSFFFLRRVRIGRNDDARKELILSRRRWSTFQAVHSACACFSQKIPQASAIGGTGLVALCLTTG